MYPRAGAVQLSPFWSPPSEAGPRIERVYAGVGAHLPRCPLGAQASPVAIVAKSHNDNVALYFVVDGALPRLLPLWLTLQEDRKRAENAAATAAGRAAPHAEAPVTFCEMSTVEAAIFAATTKRAADGRVIVDLAVGGDLGREIALQHIDGAWAMTTTLRGQPARLELLYAQMRATCASYPSVESLRLHGTALAPPFAALEETVDVAEESAMRAFARISAGVAAGAVRRVTG